MLAMMPLLIRKELIGVACTLSDGAITSILQNINNKLFEISGHNIIINIAVAVYNGCRSAVFRNNCFQLLYSIDLSIICDGISSEILYFKSLNRKCAYYFNSTRQQINEIFNYPTEKFLLCAVMTSKKTRRYLHILFSVPTDD